MKIRVAEVIPSLNVKTFEEVRERIRLVEPHVRWCHIDVTDGIFSRHETWRNPADFAMLRTTANIEVHLMVSEPEKIIEQWFVAPVKRIIVHIEAMSDPEILIKKCREAGVEIGFAINPETSVEKLEPWLGKVDLVQTLAVHPGPSGQEVDWPVMLGKITHIRDRCKSCTLEVDGGVNPHTYKNAISAGANILVAGAFIFNSKDIRAAIEELKK